MAITWDIINDTHGRIVTCQRPILIAMEAQEINVSHFKCELQIKDTDVTFDDWGWVDTGIRINAYSDDGGDIYQANFAPYCRNYFELSTRWLTQVPFIDMMFTFEENNDWNHMFRRQFRVKIWPVIFTQDEVLVEEQDNYKWNREFMVFDTNIKDNEQTSIYNYDNIRMDDFVNGNCDGGGLSNTYGDHIYRGDKFSKLLTNMPSVAPPGSKNDDMIQTINWNDGQGYFVSGMGYNFTDEIRYKRKIAITDLAGVVTTYTFSGPYGTPYSWVDTNNCDILYFNWDLVFIHIMIIMEYGVSNSVIDPTLTAVTCKHIKQWFEFETVADGVIRTSPSMEFNISDVKNDGMGCNKTRFLFKNSRGLMDFFNCYGEKEKKVSIKGDTYMKQHNVARNSNYSGGGLIKSPGQHSVSNLWNNRIEEYEIITQPIPISWSEWLEELMASPNVWIEVDDKNVESLDNVGSPAYLDTFRWRSCQRLVPIIIDKGSYEVFNTSDHMQYISFKYRISNENTVSKSF